MNDFPWEHRDGHLRAEIKAETADEITFVYQHVSDLDWGGEATLSKAVYLQNYSLTPTHKDLTHEQ